MVYQQAGMATTADLTLQQQIRPEIADSLQRVREEIHTAINGRLNAINSVPIAMQRFSEGLSETAKSYRMWDLIPKSWDGSHDKGQFRNFMAELHLWMQAWSDQGVRILVRAECVDMRSTLAVDCTDAGSRTFETALHPADREERRSTNAALISNVNERDRAKDVEQSDVILRNFINETSKYEGRFGKSETKKDSGSAKVDA